MRREGPTYVVGGRTVATRNNTQSRANHGGGKTHGRFPLLGYSNHVDLRTYNLRRTKRYDMREIPYRKSEWQSRKCIAEITDLPRSSERRQHLAAV